MASTPFKFDHVGSFLRPESLKKARRDYEAGSITAEELKSVEDEAITELIKKEKEVGLHAITDGEFRRATWHLDFMWAFDGVGHSKTETGLPFHGEAAMIDDTYLTGKIVYKTHPFIEHFKFVQQFEDEDTVAKLTIPAPAQFLEQMIMPFAWGNTKKFYDTPEQVAEDIANGYKEFIKDVYAAGCRNLQFDDCSWGMVVDPSACKFFGTTPAGLEKIKNTLLDINNSVPKDMYKESIEGKFDYTLQDTFMGFHCGNTASSKLAFCEMKYQMIMARSLPIEVTNGTLEGDIKPGDITFYRLQSTADNKLRAYIAHGEVLPVATRSFGAIGVFAIPEMGRFYRHVLIEGGFPHHGAVAFGHHGKALFEVFKYIGVPVEEIGYNQPAGVRYPTENPWR